ncbi:hypothetical protein [Burkholderia sp. USMB20]|uniref:hypothetical protein n=1 Tax=Burkholderia sp. USMB20 TaxID=1571773 RepID=UPI0005CF3171|nr:hypothetical protein [Burkholderia sp. USMB20]TGN96470.1 hypothetical protein PL79_013820 [Burkholderia sp. USMB20]
MKTTKKAAAARAKAVGLKTFQWRCQQHGRTAHYTSNGKCATCKAALSAKKYAERVSTPEGREAHNTHQRAYQRSLRNTSASYRGNGRENRAAQAYCKATGGNLPASYNAERETLRAFYAALPEGHHGDHRTPKVAKDHQGNHVASGLHTLSNLRAVPAKLNRMKATHFDPDNFRDQRPANAFPGGAWDPELTEREWARVELLVRRYGCDRDASVRTIQAQVARQRETYLQNNAA